MDKKSVTAGALAGTLGTMNRSLPEQICDHIRELIIDGTLEPGAWLRERDLAQQLNVSRIPVREALPVLEAEGFVRLVPRRGAMVATLTLREAEDLYDIRESLEVLAARLAARQARHSPPAGLLECLERGRVAAEAGDRHGLEAANAAFHGEILKLSDNPLLQSIMKPIKGRVRRLFRMLPSRDPHAQLVKHQELCDAIASGNPELAAAVAYAQIVHTRESTLSVLRTLLPES